jgi:Holliday junction resolvasome RuvABC endonuclease subunit
MIIALDPGTKCGWAVYRDGMTYAGVWDLRPNRYEGGGMRFLRLCRFLEETTKAATLDLVAYEEVRRHKGTDAAHVYGGIVATIQQWAELRCTPYCAVPVAAVKRKATGKGNAGKDEMLAAAKVRWPDIEIPDDNCADALWILECVRTEIY